MAKLKAHTLLALVSNLVRPTAKATEARHTATALRGSPLACQKSSKFIQLPDDVLHIIARHLRLGDRAHLLRTCRYLQSLVEAIQYRHLDMTTSWLYYRTVSLHQTLWERPDLIPYIITYRGPLTSYTVPKPTKLTARERLKRRLQRKQPPPSLPESIPFTERDSFRRAVCIFTKAVNIQELEFTNCTDWVSNPIWEPVRATTLKMSLTRVSLPITTELVDFVSLLRAQPELEHLELSWIATGFGNLKETDIPKLKSLRATLRDAAAIVPGRPIEEFRHVLEIGERTFDEQLVRKLSLSSASITRLTTRLCNSRDSDFVRGALQMFVRHLPEIEHLTLAMGGVVSGQISGGRVVSGNQPPALLFPTMTKLTVRTLFTPISDFVRLATLTGSAWENQKSSKFVQLPEEALLIIADYSDLADRARLLRNCRYIHSLVEGVHYRHLNMTSSRLYYRTHLLHHTLSDRPDLISLIVSYRGALMLPNEPEPLKPKTTERLKSRLLGKQMPPRSWGRIPVTETSLDRRSVSIFVKAVNIRELEFIDWGVRTLRRATTGNPTKDVVDQIFPPISRGIREIMSASSRSTGTGAFGTLGRFREVRGPERDRHTEAQIIESDTK
ncbi:hypothetical protein FS837_011185 [Tulasnella sp. UAMH 9824]|nr:hypothetical protein FS837_011185 [Tulasnella sp. UAMH 9824]